MNKVVKLSPKDFETRVRKCIEIVFKEEGLQINPSFPITFSNMTRCMGYFQYKYGKANKLNFSKNLLNGYYNMEDTDQIILHEVLHYMLFMKGFKNEKHGRNFKQACRKYNCKLDGATSNMQVTEEGKAIKQKATKYVIKCKGCGQTINRQRKSKLTENPHHYKCGKCGGELVKVV